MTGIQCTLYRDYRTEQYRSANRQWTAVDYHESVIIVAALRIEWVYEGRELETILWLKK